MPSNSLLHFITKTINIPSIKVINYHFITDSELLIEVKNKQTESVCPNCQNITNKVHQSHWYRVRDIPISTYNVFLNVNRRQFRCKHCNKVFSEELDFVKKRRTYTRRLAEKVIKEVLVTDILNTAKRNRVTPAEIETLLKEFEEDLLTQKPSQINKLGIDEITQVKGGRNYAAVLVDLETKKPITILKQRNKEVIAKYLLDMGEEFLNQIKEVSIDFWKPYKSLVEEIIPNAQIVADRFHLIKHVNEELDSKRKQEKKLIAKLENEKEKKDKTAAITNSKYSLLKKKEKLNDEEKKRIELIKKLVPDLGEMYRKKESLRDIFEKQISGNEALLKLGDWLKEGINYFPESCGTILRWIDEILAYFDNRTTQGIVEGINQKIKLIKKRAYGLTNFDNFRRRILLNWHFC